MLSLSYDIAPVSAPLPSSVSARLDALNLRFTSAVKTQLRDLSQFSTEELVWLMVEHYQFSCRNPGFLAIAAKTTENLDGPEASLELWRNYNEEKSHAAMYRQALADLGVRVEDRTEFLPTGRFFRRVEALISNHPACALGAMYATETAAIFEHEVFWSIAREVTQRRLMDWGNSRLKAFHDLHLEGVEQSHKDGLAGFADGRLVQARDRGLVLFGGTEAIDAMQIWWRTLLARIGVGLGR